MNALLGKTLPALLPTLLSLFSHRRHGLRDPADMPRIEYAVAGVRINPVWLSRYRDSVGLPDPANAALPPLALQIAASPLHLALIADARFPFRALGLVHLSQHIQQMRSIAPDALVDISVHSAGAQWEKRGMSFGLVTEVHEANQLVWRGESRALARGHNPLAPPGDGFKHPDNRLVDHSEVPTDVAYGALLATLSVAEDTGRRYARIAGDRNPIHQHALLARPFGFRRAIVHGTWTMARALALAGLPLDGVCTIAARFRRPVELPSRIRVHADHDESALMRRVTVLGAEHQVHLEVDIAAHVGTTAPAQVTMP